jgi:serine/threonine-protein kinase
VLELGGHLASVAKALPTCPHLSRLRATGAQSGQPFAVIDPPAGVTLGMAPGWAEETDHGEAVIRAVLTGLAALHDADLVHGGIGPDSFAVGREGVGRLSLAGLWGDPPELACAPERRLGWPASIATDLYAVAAVAYHALTGRQPGPASPPIGHLRPDLSPGTAVAIDRALDPDPAGRPTSAAALAAAVGGHPDRALTAPGPVPEARPVSRRTAVAGNWDQHQGRPGHAASASLRVEVALVTR